MEVVDVTPLNRQLAGSALPEIWVSATYSAPLSCGLKLQTRVVLNPDSIDKTVWPTALLKKIYTLSRPVQLPSRTSEWAAYWEVYSHMLNGHADRPFFIGDSSKAAQNAMKEMLSISESFARIKSHIQEAADIVRNRSIDCSIGSDASGNMSADDISRNIPDTTLDTLADSAQAWMDVTKSTHWPISVESASDPAVLRAWKNKITIAGEKPDIIVGAGTDGKVLEIAFALANVTAGGMIVIYLPRLSGSVIAMIHICAQFFEYTRIIHTIAQDNLYLCGSIANPPSNAIKNLIYRSCLQLKGDQLPFAETDMHTTVEKLAGLERIMTWRRNEYEKILKINTELTKSTSSKLFNNYDTYIKMQYRDFTDDWAFITNYTADK